MFPVPRPAVPSTPDGEYVNARSAHGAARASPGESRPRGRPLTAPTREPTCRTARASLMIDPVATTPKRPPADRRPRGREALSTHPPTPVDDTPTGSLEQPAEDTCGTRDASPETADLRNTQPQPGARHRLSTGAALQPHSQPRPDRRLPRRVLHRRRPRRRSPKSLRNPPALLRTPPAEQVPPGSENGRQYPNRLAVRLAVGRVVSYV